MITTLVDTMGHATCRHCGRPIELLQPHYELEPHWAHVPEDDSGSYRRECPTSTYAAPEEAAPIVKPGMVYPITTAIPITTSWPVTGSWPISPLWP